eukprot:403332751
MYYLPTKIDYKELNFLILSAPVDSLMRQTIKDLKHNNCNILVRTCEKTYNEDMIRQEGIQILDLEFPDGYSPPRHIISKWLKLVSNQIKSKSVLENPEVLTKLVISEKSVKTPQQSLESLSIFQSQPALSNIDKNSRLSRSQSSSSAIKSTGKNQAKKPIRIAIHCLAGLGRAPVLVAVALINYGATPEEAISIIRKDRPGAINHSQAQFILKYKKKHNTKNCCIF